MSPHAPPFPETFRRVVDAYDLPRLSQCHVISIGIGGAASFVEDLARAGVGRLTLIDPDIVSETNLATQQVYRRDIGRPKVACVAARIRDINPAAVVGEMPCSLDEIDDEAFARLLGTPDGQSPPVATLLCGLTDNFYAQARVNRLALQFGLLSLCAQVYYQGRGAELTFTAPGVTPACHRCVLKPRYDAYLDHGYTNTVTSDGTPIFATGRLNALKGFIAMALLHHGMFPLRSFPMHGHGSHGSDELPSYRRWGTLLDRIADRNLIQIRMDPDLSETVGLKVFDRVFANSDQSRMLFDETVWLPQQPETDPPCPDCGGTGDLRLAIGTLADTRLRTLVTI